MELSEFGFIVLTFFGGMGIGAVLMSAVYYNIGAKKKEKNRVEKIEDRLFEIERKIGL